MAKSVDEILDAHKTTIEAITGKKCEIILIDKEVLILKRKSFLQILQAVETLNGSPSIFVKKKTDELVQLRKLFCLLASYGHNNKQISKFLQLSYDQVRYYQRHVKNDLQIDADFKQRFEQVKAFLLSSN